MNGFSGYGESNYRVADWVGRELPIRNVAAKCIHNELLTAHDISYGCGLRAAPMGHACAVEGEQDFSRCSMCSVEPAVALAEKTKSPATSIPDLGGCAT